ncbi:MAG TPA: DUF4307 domain-containing protein [Nocardioides sp.]|uniref:DUF4307 domain-containing protein n=1 Tax=Nocardioides sp. TaxID=35761 RepID=UPI002D7FA262|nr:DUF4307 domain-containing protein [Nocardioides sp.]HET6654288.1 DUF4307 domain-containing protein [Nocardioides sp.]
MTDLADRYGTRTSTSRKGLVAVMVILAGVGLSWLAWVMLVHGRPLVQSDLNGFETVDAHTTTAEFTVVRRDDRVRASCLIRAFAADHAIVGELDVAVGPGAPTTQTLERAVRTERQATSVEVVGCVADGQSQRR